MNRIVSFSLVAAIFAFFCIVPAFGQSGTGELTGLVTDSTGAVVSNATITLTNSATGEKRTTVTTGAGIYRFAALPIVGTYTLDMAPKGFKAIKVANVILSVGTVTSRDVQLEVGSATETVTVEAGGETVQTQESALSQLVDRNIWQNMPLAVRNQNSFIELVAGAVPQDGSGQNRGAVVNGTRGGTGNYLVEGMDNNEQGQAGRGQISNYDKGGAATSISPDAIQEYRVITNSYSAEYGKGGGFITDTVLRSGANSWHGSAFEYNRVQALAANDWFSTRNDIQDALVRNQFGGSLGGPIVKDKMFWYGVGEIHRVRQTYPTGAVQATTQQFLDFVKTGGLEQWAESDPGGICVVGTGSACPGAFANSATWGPIFTNLYGNPAMHYPVANVPGVTCNTTDPNADPSCFAKGVWSGGLGLIYPVPVYGTVNLPDHTSQNEARWSLKWDYKVSEKDSLSAFYDFQDATFIDPYLGGANVIGPTYIQDGRGQELGITWNHTFTPTVLNSFKAGYLRHRLDFPPAAGTFGIPSYYTLDGTGVDLGLSSGLPQFFTDNQFQYLDTLSIVRGKHSFKLGGEYRRTRNGSTFYNGNFGTVLPWGVEDVLTDLKFSNEADIALTGGGYYGGAYYIQAAVDTTNGQQPVLYRGFRANEWAGFVQDDWRVSNRFTVNLGLRWEYFGPPHNFQPGLDANEYFGSKTTPIINPNTGNPCNDPVTGNPFCPANDPFYAGASTEAIQLRNHDIWNKDTNNFGPRVGFAWDLFGKQKFVLRGGFGVMYDRIYNNTFENIRFNPPHFSLNTVFFYGPLTSPAPGQPDLFSYPFTTRQFFNDPSFAPLPNPRHMNEGMVTPYFEQAHFGFQYEFARGWVFEPEYVGTFGHKLTGLRDINTFNGRNSFGTFNCPTGTEPDCRPNLNVGADNYRSNDYASNYHAFQATVRKAFSRGVTFNANYTYSKALDEVSDLFLNRSASRPTDNMNIHNDYGPADFDVRHRAVFTVGYELPFMKKNRFLGGWGVNSIISYQTGHPFSPYSSSRSYDPNKDGYRTDRIVPLESPNSTILGSSAVDACMADPTIGGRCYWDATQWVRYNYSGGQVHCPASVNGGFWCDPPVHRNSIFGPAFANVDFNVSKRFRITESSGLTFQANFFDLFNHPNFVTPTTSQNLSAATFGQLTATAGDNGGHRVAQMALRFDF